MGPILIYFVRRYFPASSCQVVLDDIDEGKEESKSQEKDDKC
jgi:hypothetical protein